MPVPWWNALRMSRPSLSDLGTTFSLCPLITAGSMTWKPWPLAGAPSPWMARLASACARLAIFARSSTHGPTPLSFLRVRMTLAPFLARRSFARRFATSQVNACSA